MARKSCVELEAAELKGVSCLLLQVAAFELVPLFPTQPLSLASGLLFGTQVRLGLAWAGCALGLPMLRRHTQPVLLLFLVFSVNACAARSPASGPARRRLQTGAACMCVGTTLASALAFSIARGVGKPLAEKVIEHELDELEHSGVLGAPDERGAAKPKKESLVSRFRHIEEAIEHGSFWKQAGAVLLLRLMVGARAGCGLAPCRKLQAARIPLPQLCRRRPSSGSLGTLCAASLPAPTLPAAGGALLRLQLRAGPHPAAHGALPRRHRGRHGLLVADLRLAGRRLALAPGIRRLCRRAAGGWVGGRPAGRAGCCCAWRQRA